MKAAAITAAMKKGLFLFTYNPLRGKGSDGTFSPASMLILNRNEKIAILKIPAF